MIGQGGYSRAPRWPVTYTADDWMRLLAELGVRPLTSAKWSQPFAADVQPARFSAGMADLRAWLPQVLHETGMLEHTAENLDYSAERLVQVWPARFPSIAAAQPYAHNPPKLAEKVYGGRMGNRPEGSGDGWAFHGRGLIMVTGRAGYRRAGDLAGQDYESMPDLLEQPHFAIEAAIAWWEGTIPDSALGDQAQCRRRVNGGTLGLAHCQELADLTAKVLA